MSAIPRPFPLLRLSLCLHLAGLGGAWAIPDVFFGNGNFIGPIIPATPRFNANLTRDILLRANWDAGNFPGPWEEDATAALEGTVIRRMTANPVLFGAVPDSVRAYGSEERGLEELIVTYADAGRYFGYREGGERTADEREAGSEKRAEFRRLHREAADNLNRRLASGCGRGRLTTRGRSHLLRETAMEYRWEGFVLRVVTRPEHSVALHLQPEDRVARDFLDPGLAGLTERERSGLLRENLRRTERGDLRLEGVPMFRQGMTPLCGIHSLAMAGHYLGLRLPVEGLAAAAGLRNTGTARGADIPGVYRAAGEEIGMAVKTSSRFDERRVREALEAGLPVVVWRRVSQEREEAHFRFASRLRKDPGATLPGPDRAMERAWPERDRKSLPSHASVITGLNPERGEVIFTEPWGEHARDRRMRVEEMAATSYAVFFFSW